MKELFKRIEDAKNKYDYLVLHGTPQGDRFLEVNNAAYEVAEAMLGLQRFLFKDTSPKNKNVKTGVEVNMRHLSKESSITSISAPIQIDGLCLDVSVDYYPDGEFDYIRIQDEDGDSVKLTPEQNDRIITEISKSY